MVHKFTNFTVELLSFQLRPDHGGLATLQITNTGRQTVLAMGANQYLEYGGSYISAKLIDENGNVIRCKRSEGLLPLHPAQVGFDFCTAFGSHPKLNNVYLDHIVPAK